VYGCLRCFYVLRQFYTGCRACALLNCVHFLQWPQYCFLCVIVCASDLKFSAVILYVYFNMCFEHPELLLLLLINACIYSLYLVWNALSACPIYFSEQSKHFISYMSFLLYLYVRGCCFTMFCIVFRILKLFTFVLEEFCNFSWFFYAASGIFRCYLLLIVKYLKKLLSLMNPPSILKSQNSPLSPQVGAPPYAI
jgi:hypothetical protein